MGLFFRVFLCFLFLSDLFINHTVWGKLAKIFIFPKKLPFFSFLVTPYSLIFSEASHLLLDLDGLFPNVWSVILPSRAVDWGPGPANSELVPHLSRLSFWQYGHYACRSKSCQFWKDLLGWTWPCSKHLGFPVGFGWHRGLSSLTLSDMNSCKNLSAGGYNHQWVYWHRQSLLTVPLVFCFRQAWTKMAV